MSDINFSIVITARNQPANLLRCVKQFIAKAKYPEKNEIIIMTDYDDHDTIDIFKDDIFQHYNIHTILRPQSGILQLFNMTKYYVNHGVRYSTGKYIWSVNAECKPETEHWDDIFITHIEQYLADKPDRIVYIGMDDDTQTPEAVAHGPHKDLPGWKGVDRMKTYGCCFPLTTRETHDAMGMHLPEELTFWGADVVFYQIFKALPYDRILWLLDKVKILHESVHNGKIPLDEGGQAALDRNIKLSYVGNLTPPQRVNYINKLSSAIANYQP